MVPNMFWHVINMCIYGMFLICNTLIIKPLLTYHVCLLSALVFQTDIVNPTHEHFDNFSVAPY